jgi:hypothetical protein
MTDMLDWVNHMPKVKVNLVEESTNVETMASSQVKTTTIDDTTIALVQANTGTESLRGRFLDTVAISDRTIPLEGMECEKDLPPLPSSCSLSRHPVQTKELDAVTSYSWYGPACAAMIPGVFNGSAHNEKAALLGRHLSDVGADNPLWELASSKHLDTIYAICQYDSISNDEWLEGQPKNKQERYRKVFKNPKEYDFANVKLHKRSMFVKKEVQITAANGDLRTKFPRGIQGLARPETNTALGPFMNAVSKALSNPFNQCDDGQWPQFCYTSGATPEHIGAWYTSMVNNGCNFVEDDFSAFDSTQGKGCHLAEVKFFNKFNPPEIARQALNFQSRTVGYGTYHKYSVPYTRKSGDQNTSIGNTYINFLSHAFAISTYCEKYGTKVQYSMLGLGDDNLLAVDVPLTDMPKFVSHCEATIKLMGLSPKIKLSNEAPTYCSSEFMPMLDSTGSTIHLLVPQVLRVVAKMGFTVSKIHPRKGETEAQANLMRLKGNFLGLQSARQIPILRAFFNYYVKQSGKASAEYQYRCHRVHIANNYQTGPATSAWFLRVYGLTTQEVSTLESYITGMLNSSSGAPVLWNHPHIETMMDHRRAIE